MYEKEKMLTLNETLLNKGNSPYVGEMVNGVREGKGTYSFENGDKYWKKIKKSKNFREYTSVFDTIF